MAETQIKGGPDPIAHRIEGDVLHPVAPAQKE